MLGQEAWRARILSLTSDKARNRRFLVVGKGNLRWDSARDRFQKKERLGRPSPGSAVVVVADGRSE